MSEFIKELSAVRDKAELIYDQAAMDECFDRLAEAISENLDDTLPLLLPVMLGGVYLCGQLMQRLNFPLELDYLHATRYRDKLQGAELDWIVPPSLKVQGRTVLVIDDILDQGLTLAGVVDALNSAGAKQVQTVVMTVKQCARDQALDVSYKGLDVPDKYVFGCGMDYKGYWRNLPEIYAVAQS